MDLIKHCELDKNMRNYCITYYTLNNNVDILSNVFIDAKEYYELLSSNYLFSKHFFGNPFVKFTQTYIESLNITNVYQLYTHLKIVADTYYPDFEKFYNRLGNCDSECFHMFLIHDFDGDLITDFNEDSTDNNFCIYLDFMYNNYFNEFLVIKKFIDDKSFPDAQNIFNDFLLKNNYPIDNNNEENSSINEIGYEQTDTDKQYNLLEHHIYKIVSNSEDELSDREIIDSICEVDIFKNIVFIDTDSKRNYIKCVFSKESTIEFPLYSYATHKLIIEHFIYQFDILLAINLTIDNVIELWNNYNSISNHKIILLGEHELNKKYNEDMIDDMTYIYAINDNNEFIDLNYLKESVVTILKNPDLSLVDVYIYFNKKIEYIDNKYIFELFSYTIEDNQNPIYYEIYSQLTNTDAKQYLIKMLIE